MQTPSRWMFAAGFLAVTALVQGAQASLIGNGDFEQGMTGTGGNTTFVDWYLQNGNGIAPSSQTVYNAPTPYAGNYAAELNAGVALVQNLSPNTTSPFTISFEVASTAAGTTGSREFQFIAGDRTVTGSSTNDVDNDTKINLIVNKNASGTGDVELNTGSGFVTPGMLGGSFVFSSSLSTPTWNLITIQGTMDGTIDSNYSVTVNGDSSGTLTGFQAGSGESNTIPTSLARIAFNAESSTAFVVDNVSVTPEPASLSLLGVGALGLIRRRRRAC